MPDDLPAMGDLGEMIRYENANSGLAFRDRPYLESETSELLRDVLSLANAGVTGPRFLVLGVRDAVGGDRQVVGLERGEIARLQKSIAALAARCIEPPLKISVRGCAIDSVSVAIVTIQLCDDPPYLLKLDLSDIDHVGRGWIRRGTAAHPLTRIDLQRMFERRTPIAIPISVAIGFPGKLPRDEATLPALPLDEVPSKVAAHRLQRMLEGKQSARDLLGRTETRLSRLLHARLYGGDVPFEKHSDESLRKRLEDVARDHRLADEHYEFEQRAHKLQLVVRNCSDVAIDQAMLELKIMRIDGIGLSEHSIAGATEIGAPASGTPAIDADATRYLLQTAIGRIPKRSTVPAFREPPRLWIRESACGKTILLEYRLHCRQSSEPIAGVLRLHVDAAAPAQAEQSGSRTR